MKKYINKKAIVLFILFFNFIICFGQTNHIIAKVNNQIITSGDLEKYSQMILNKNNKQILTTEDQVQEEALNRLIEDKLILEEAKKEGIEAPQSWLENKIEQLALAGSDREAFYDSLKEQGVTISYLKNRLSQQYLMKEIIDRKVKAEISVLPGKIEQFYKENRKEFQSPALVDFVIAKGKDKKMLEGISTFIEKEGIKKAEEKYNSQLSEINTSLGRLQEPLSEALKSLKDKEHLIKKIDDLYYLIYRKKVNPSQALTLSEAQDKVYKYLWQKQFSERFNDWVDSLKKDAVIEIYSFANSQNN
ncbi:MAG: SurA N-terminal domain-containing protein [Candidatus Omnitrophica bacterium]|nr:SurA N-terminal domain-containing protein [Candidatus Omnitrophota bacterium]MCF7894670.1 SurA N-terminal domain-containing protein [Candidatus Omnitrophota bacterium]